MFLDTHSSMVVSQAGSTAASDLPLRLEGHVVTVTQREDEPLSELAHRVRQEAASLHAMGRVLSQVVFIARPDFDRADVLAAADLIRAVVTGMVERGQGNVHLHTAAADANTRFALMALADAVGDQVRGTGVHVHTRTLGASGTVRIAELARRAAG